MDNQQNKEITVKRLILCALAVFSIQLSAQAQETAKDILTPRSGVVNFCRDVAASVNLDKSVKGRKVVYFGNNFLYERSAYVHLPWDIMRPAEAKDKKSSFPGMLHSYMPKFIPGSQVGFQIATLDSPSWNAAFYFTKQGALLRTSGGFPPDAHMVVLDFTYNDRGMPEQTIIAGVEGMIRQAWKEYPNVDIVLLYTPNTEFLKDYRSGKEPEVITVYEKIADRYNLPSVNLAKLISDKIIAGEVKEEEMFLSATVVSEKCDQLCFNAFKPLLVSGLETAKQSPKTEAHAIPQPLGKYMVTSPSVEEYQSAQLEPGWIDWQPSPLYRFLHVLKCQEPGPAMTVRFKGSLLGMEMVVGPDSGDVEVSIDGSPWQFKKASIENSDRDYVDLPVLLAEGLDPSAEHALKLRVAPETPKGNKDKVVRISKLLVNGKIIFDDPWKGLTQLQRIDKIYAGLEPVKYQPPADRWKNIPKTMRTLNEGPNLTIVSLGDSLVNDTCSSSFQLLIERMYPKCKVKNVVSVRGGGGCQFYKIDNNVQEYVLRHKPDLLIIGGISNGGKDAKDAAENVREVIRQVKAALPDTEFLLMTGPFGLIQDPRQIENWKEFVTPDGTDPRSCLMKVAVEERADFIDMHGIVGRYVLESKFPVRSFQRDHIHANWRGMQVLGRIIEKYFEPKKN